MKYFVPPALFLLPWPAWFICSSRPRTIPIAPAHGIFFAVAGLTQWAWTVAFWRRPTLALYRAGLAVSGGLLVLWLLTLALPAPLGGHEAGSIDASTVVCKVSELVGLMALVALAVQGGQLITDGKLPAPRLMSEAFFIRRFSDEKSV